MENHGNVESRVKLQRLRDGVIWHNERERYELLEKLSPLIKEWQGPLPDLHAIFERDEIDWLLTECVWSQSFAVRPRLLVDLAISTGYRDEPELGPDGRPSADRTTPIHHASRAADLHRIVAQLFRIYDRFDVNYRDGSGLTHFHCACMCGCYDAARRFLDEGQDPDYLVQVASDEPVEPALHSAVRFGHTRVVQLLLERGRANPNLVNAQNGRTALHVVCNCTRGSKHGMARLLIETSESLSNSALIDAQDHDGNTTLHLAIGQDCKGVIMLLLTKGANPNVPNSQGLTALHMICTRAKASSMIAVSCMRLLLVVSDQKKTTLNLEARDDRGDTPLRLAVAHLMAREVALLLERGADLAGFEFPTKADFLRAYRYWDVETERVLGLMSVLEALEKKGYAVSESDARTVADFFAGFNLFDKIARVRGNWLEKEAFLRVARNVKLKSGQSIDDLMRARPEDVKSLATYDEYCDIARSNRLIEMPRDYRAHCNYRVCDMMCRTFFQRFDFDPFAKPRSNGSSSSKKVADPPLRNDRRELPQRAHVF